MYEVSGAETTEENSEKNERVAPSGTTEVNECSMAVTHKEAPRILKCSKEWRRRYESKEEEIMEKIENAGHVDDRDNIPNGGPPCISLSL